ncbi:MAG: hypothetical protein LBK61_01295 [Spirochaetaceae bacterium]|jgi:hypothetical protein|nr:hypothetical protein [Spirochaetaceae bacterium]
MAFIKVKKLMFLSLFFAISFVFAEEQFRGRMLIMGRYFAEEDTSTQTNIAIDAIIKYAEDAKYQMNSYERFNYSCKIELYRVGKDSYYNGGLFEDSRIFVYIKAEITDSAIISNSNIIEFSGNDYHDRCIEIDFYIVHNETPSKYKLVLYYNNYNWLENNEGNNQYELFEKDDSAYDFFIYELEKLRR